MKTLTLTLALTLTLSAASLADGPDCQASTANCQTAASCPTGAKVVDLLGRWDAAEAQLANLSPEALEALGAEVARVSASCPIGSRMGSTMIALHDVLGLVIASSEANAEHCPLASSDDPSFADARGMKELRAQALSGLHRLAGHAAAATTATCSKPAEASCSKDALAACAAPGCELDATRCPIRVASTLGGLRTSFAAAEAEVKALTADQRSALFGGIANLAGRSQAIALMPETVVVLAEGLGALDRLHADLMAWANEHPALFTDLPESARSSMRTELALLAEARELLTAVTQAMSAMHAPADAPLTTAAR